MMPCVALPALWWLSADNAVEAMTDEVEAAAVALIEQVDSLGGAVYAIETCFQALAARATVGEVCHALRDVWGTYVPPERF